MNKKHLFITVALFFSSLSFARQPLPITGLMDIVSGIKTFINSPSKACVTSNVVVIRVVKCSEPVAEAPKPKSDKQPIQ